MQWPERFPELKVRESAERGELYVMFDSNTIVATLTLQWSDPMFWGDRADAGFLHRLAVRRSHAGVGVASADSEAVGHAITQSIGAARSPSPAR